MTIQPSPLGTPGIRDMLSLMLETLPVDPKRDPADGKIRQQAAAAAFAALLPRDALEAELAARVVTAHYAAMDCFRRAALPAVSDDVAIRLRGTAVSLSRMAERLITALDRRRAMVPSGVRPAIPATLPGAVAGPAPRGQNLMPSGNLMAASNTGTTAATAPVVGVQLAAPPGPNGTRQPAPADPRVAVGKARGHDPVSSGRQSASPTPVIPPPAAGEDRLLPGFAVLKVKPVTMRQELLASVSLPHGASAAASGYSPWPVG